MTPAGKDCFTASDPPFAPTPGSFAVNEQVPAPARGISTAMDGLSKNCELLPLATMCVSMYVIGSSCSLLLRSLYLATKTELTELAVVALVARSNANPA